MELSFKYKSKIEIAVNSIYPRYFTQQIRVPQSLRRFLGPPKWPLCNRTTSSVTYPTEKRKEKHKKWTQSVLCYHCITQTIVNAHVFISQGKRTYAMSSLVQFLYLLILIIIIIPHFKSSSNPYF